MRSKGHWYVHTFAPDVHAVVTHAGHEIASCRSAETARLLVAAPNLLAACQAALGQWLGGSWADDAINKRVAAQLAAAIEEAL